MPVRPDVQSHRTDRQLRLLRQTAAYERLEFVSLVAFRAQNHPQQLALRGAKSEVDNRATAPEIFEPLHRRFRFTVDACASPDNAKLERFYSEADNGLIQSWAGERVWCNPPYSNIRPWVEKAWADPAELVVILVPANRTEQRWWQELIEPHRDRDDTLRVEFLPGRIRFIGQGRQSIGPNERPPFGCCLLIFSHKAG